MLLLLQTNKQTKTKKNPATNQPSQLKPKRHFTDLQNLALQVVDLVVRTPELGLLGHDLQTHVGALALQLVGRGLVLLRLLRQLAVLLQQVRALRFLGTQQTEGEGSRSATIQREAEGSQSACNPERG